MDTLSIKVFPAATNLPLWVAADCGFMRRRGLALEIRYTGGSVEQLSELIVGKHDLVLTLFDNVVAYSSGQGEVEAVGDTDLVACFACDDGFPRLTVQADITGFGDLRGRRVSVDAMTTGFAFLLRQLLEANGIGPDEVEFVSVGGVLQRWQAMMKGEHAGTLLVTPFELMAEPQGLRIIGRDSEPLRAYQGNVIATRRSWARDNADRVVAFIGGYLDALDWLFAPENRDDAIAILRKHMPEAGEDVARRTCSVFLSHGGLFRDGRPSAEGIDSVLALRRRYGPAGGALATPDSYFERRFLDAANQLRRDSR